MRFDDKTILITGAASWRGIGFASARRVEREGGRLILTDLKEVGLAERVAELEALGATAIGLAHDVADAESWQSILPGAVDRFGWIDGLVNNAGITMLAPVEVLDLAMWDWQISVNLTSIYLGCRALIAHSATRVVALLSTSRRLPALSACAAALPNRPASAGCA